MRSKAPGNPFGFPKKQTKILKAPEPSNDSDALGLKKWICEMQVFGIQYKSYLNKWLSGGV